jgi:hypothetical protein
MYSSSFFYHDAKKTFSFSDIELEKISKLKSSIEESGYYNRMLVWKLEDNLDVVKDIAELSKLFITMQFLSMSASPTKELIKQMDVKKWHMSLLRRLYLEFDDYDDNKIMMGYKRPFGNSYVIGDVREEMVKYNYFSKLKNQHYNPIMFEDNYEDSPEEESELNKFVDFLNEFYKGNFICHFNSFRCDSYSFTREIINPLWGNFPHMHEYRAHSYMRSWDIDKSHMRNEKIEKILK